MNIYYSDKAMPYVYKCVNRTTGQYYFGYRELNVKINRPSTVDLPIYRTSSKKVKPIFDQFEWMILAEFLSADAAYDFEQYLISTHWGDPLLLNNNCRIGNRFKGKVKHSSQSLVKMSESKRGSKNPMFGKTGSLNPCFGRKQSEETIQKKIASMSGLTKNAETRGKISHALKGKKKGIIKCPHCNKEGAPSPMYRWHFENCKMLK